MAKDTLLSLKFSGESLDVRSVPIYELGDTLVALQRMVHKTFLAEEERLRKRAQLTRVERKRLSLQISERTKSSDLYALVPFLADTETRNYLAALMKIGLGALARYALGRVFSSEQSAHRQTSVKVGDIEGSLLVGAIYAETVQITNHINNIGGVDRIDLIPGDRALGSPVILTPETQKYVRQIANERYRGPPEEIVGYVTRMYPNRLLAQIKVGPARYVKVGLDEEMFRFVRYKTQPEEELRFKGRPLIRLGKDRKNYDEFEADTVERQKA